MIINLTMRVRIKNLLYRWKPFQFLLQFLWAVLLITIPMSSSPWVARFAGWTNASPLAGIPLFLLLVFSFLPYILKRGSLPKVAVPLFIFVGVAMFSSALAPFREIYPVFGQNVPMRTLRAFLTLMVGLGFYLVSWHLVRSEEWMRRSLIWLYVGGLILLIWASVQTYYLTQDIPYPAKVQNLHRLFSIRDLPRDRVTGFAYEPSWLGDQLAVLYLPLWVSSVVHGYSVFTKKSRRLSIELGLMIWGALILFFSHSRIGLISALLSFGVVGLNWGWRRSGSLVQGIRNKQIHVRERSIRIDAGLLRLASWIVLVLFISAIGLAVIRLSSNLDWRLAQLFKTDYSGILRGQATSIYAISESLAYAERVMWWVMGLRVFGYYPLLGAGLGNTGFFFKETVPGYAYHLPEMFRAFTGRLYFPNPANLWIRLLAETGIAGFIVFVNWLSMLLLGARELVIKGRGWRSMIGLAGVFALIAQVTEGFSLSSFALPQLWVMLGFLTAALSTPTITRGKPGESE